MSDLSRDQLEQLVQGHHWDPLAILGAHPITQGNSSSVVIRCFLPEATNVALLLGEHTRHPIPMRRLHKAGVFEVTVQEPLGTTP